MSGPLAAAGHRVIAPDLIGFGRSDKPARRENDSYEAHVDWMAPWFERLDLTGITLFAQDWGGLIGLRLVAAMPERFARLVVGNTGLPVGTGGSDGFAAWLKFSQETPEFKVGNIVAGGCRRQLLPGEIAAYDAPFADGTYKAGARQFPALVPITPDHAVAENKAAWAVLDGFTRPVVTCCSDHDPVTKGGERVFHERMSGATGQPHTIVANAGFPAGGRARHSGRNHSRSVSGLRLPPKARGAQAAPAGAARRRCSSSRSRAATPAPSGRERTGRSSACRRPASLRPH